MKQNVVIISGGNGSGVSINACKTFLEEVALSAVIPMSDSGGSTGRLRREFDTLPVGDIMRAVIAMSKHDAGLLKQLFYRMRFKKAGKLDGHNLGNLFLILAEQYGGDFVHALTALHPAVEAVGTVHPVTLDVSDLAVELASGEQVVGEHEIDRPKSTEDKITRAWLEPQPALYNGAKEALKKADVIVFGPGSLYCSVIPSLLVADVQEVLEKSSAKLVYVVGNAFEEHGEAGPRVLSKFISTLESYLPRALDAVVFNNHSLSEHEQKRYQEKQWTLITNDVDDNDPRVIVGDFERSGGGLDPDKLGALLKDVIC